MAFVQAYHIENEPILTVGGLGFAKLWIYGIGESQPRTLNQTQSLDKNVLSMLELLAFESNILRLQHANVVRNCESNNFASF
jgi:hypothetical protein